MKALANALGGGHMRSLVDYFKAWMDDEGIVSMKYLLNRMDQEYGTNVNDNDLVDVQRHVLTCIRSREAKGLLQPSNNCLTLTMRCHPFTFLKRCRATTQLNKFSTNCLVLSPIIRPVNNLRRLASSMICSGRY